MVGVSRHLALVGRGGEGLVGGRATRGGLGGGSNFW